MMKVRVNVYTHGDLVEKEVFLNSSEISEVVDPISRPQLGRSCVGDGGNEVIGAVIIMRNGNAYRVIDGVDDIVNALEA